MKKKNQKDFNIQEIKKFLQDPRGQGIAFFGFYFIFFLFIFCLFQFSDGQVVQSSDYERGNSKSYLVDSIKMNNYTFSYDVMVDQIHHIYSGKRYQNTMRFDYNNLEYYYDGTKYYRKDNMNWVECDNPFVYSEFLDIKNISLLLDASSYESHTTYESGKNSFNYLLSSNTIFFLLQGIDADYFEEPNSLVIGTDEDNQLNQIKFSLNQYGVLNHICNSIFKISIDYDKFGEVEEIKM